MLAYPAAGFVLAKKQKVKKCGLQDHSNHTTEAWARVRRSARATSAALLLLLPWRRTLPVEELGSASLILFPCLLYCFRDSKAEKKSLSKYNQESREH